MTYRAFFMCKKITRLRDGKRDNDCYNSYSGWREPPNSEREDVEHFTSSRFKTLRFCEDAMAYIPVPNVVQAQMIYDWGGQAVENVFNYKFGVDPNASIMIDLATDLVAWWDTEIRGGCPENFTLLKVICTDLTSQNSPGIEFTVDLPMSGTSTDPVMPANVTLAIKWNTAYRGRSYRGRTYHMPIKRSWIVDSKIDDSSLTGLIASYTLLPDISAGGLNPVMVVVSRFHNKAPRIEGVATAIQSVSADNTVDSQRRRLPGRGQ